MLKKSLIILFTFLILILIYCSTLLLTSLLPKTTSLYNNCLDSAKTIVKETGFFNPFLFYVIDNNSDAIIVNEAYCMDSESPIASSLLVRRSYDKNKTKYIIKKQVGNLNTYFMNGYNNSRRTYSRLSIN